MKAVELPAAEHADEAQAATRQPLRPDVFLSYSRRDEESVRPLADALEAHSAPAVSSACCPRSAGGLAHELHSPRGLVEIAVFAAGGRRLVTSGYADGGYAPGSRCGTPCRANRSGRLRRADHWTPSAPTGSSRP